MTRRHHGHDPDVQAMYTRRRLLAASAVAAVPVASWWMLGRRGGDAPAGRRTTTTPPPGVSQGIGHPARADSSASTVPVTTASEPPVGPLRHDLRLGVVEPEVGALQARLAELAFDPGPVDDYFGEATLRSVWAFQKLVMAVPRDRADGVVTPAMWDRLHASVSIAPRRTPGSRHLEVYLPEQVAVLYVDGAPRVVSHVSSGEGVEWCDEVTIDLDDGTQETKGICGLSITPGGVYHFERKIEGWRNAKLGRLYKPVYFNYGIAIHGATDVPNFPASRGCVRFPMHIAEYIQDLVEIGDLVYVFDGIETPEHYGAQPMIFDWPDPDYTTTTSTSSTTSTTSTTSPPAPTTTPPTAPTTTTTSSTVPTTSTTSTSTTMPAQG